VDDAWHYLLTSGRMPLLFIYSLLL
jgi:hypothetical protein